MNAKSYWQKLQKVGWLDYVPKDQHEEIRALIQKNLNGANPDMVSAALARAVFEAGKTDYKDVLQELTDASGGLFRPTKKAAKVTKTPPVEVSFQHEGKRYSCFVSSESERLQETDYANLVAAANQALASAGADERFFILPLADVFISVVFVPPSIYKAAEKANLIPREVVWSREDAFYLNEMAMCYAASKFEDSLDGKLAVKFAKQAVALDPDNLDYMETLAMAYARMGDFEEAIRCQQVAMKEPRIQTDDARQRLELYRNNRPYQFS